LRAAISGPYKNFSSIAKQNFKGCKFRAKEIEDQFDNHQQSSTPKSCLNQRLSVSAQGTFLLLLLHETNAQAIANDVEAGT
jgi:hypothetical protein